MRMVPLYIFHIQESLDLITESWHNRLLQNMRRGHRQKFRYSNKPNWSSLCSDRSPVGREYRSNIRKEPQWLGHSTNCVSWHDPSREHRRLVFYRKTGYKEDISIANRGAKERCYALCISCLSIRVVFATGLLSNVHAASNCVHAYSTRHSTFPLLALNFELETWYALNLFGLFIFY